MAKKSSGVAAAVSVAADIGRQLAEVSGKWIPIGSRKPAVDTDVLLLWADEPEAEYAIGAIDSDGDWFGYGLLDNSPSHWMALPSPPSKRPYSR